MKLNSCLWSWIVLCYQRNVSPADFILYLWKEERKILKPGFRWSCIEQELPSVAWGHPGIFSSRNHLLQHCLNNHKIQTSSNYLYCSYWNMSFFSDFHISNSWLRILSILPTRKVAAAVGTIYIFHACQKDTFCPCWREIPLWKPTFFTTVVMIYPRLIREH